MKKLTQLLCLGLLAAGSMTSYGANDMTWERTWLDQVTLRWQPPVEQGTPYEAFTTDKWQPQFGYIINHSCTFTDGNYIYSGYSPFCKYTMEGEYVETMETDELADVWKVAYDGENFYMMMWEKLGLYIVDPVTFKIKGVVPTPASCTQFTYIPTLDEGRGGFLIGTINHLYFINRYGDFLDGVIDMTPQISDKYHCAATAYLNGKIYTYCDDNKGGRLVLPYDAKTLEYTGERFDLNDFADKGIVPSGYVARQVFPYTRPDNKQYLLFVDYNYSRFFCTSVLIGEQKVGGGIIGYNLYRNGQKINSEMLSADDYVYFDKNLTEKTQYKYELKGVTASGEGETVCQTTVTLPDTKTLPMLEEFDTYVHPNDNWFRMWTFPTNFLYVDNPGDEDSWKVISYRKNTGDSYIQYYHGTDEKYEKSLVGRPLTARQGSTVKASVRYGGNSYLGDYLDKELMHIEVSNDGMKTWKKAGTLRYRQDAYNYVDSVYDITSLVDGKEFVVRLRPDGENVTDNAAKYSWQIAAVNIWDEQPLQIGGNFTYNGKTPDSALDLTFVLHDLGDTFTATTDASGKYSLKGIYAGVYDLTVSNGNYSYKFPDIQLEQSGDFYSFNIEGGKFGSSQTLIEANMRPESQKKVEVPVANAGTPTVPYAYFEFESEGKEAIGENDVEAAAEWKVMNYFEPYDVYRNGTPVFYKGYFYSKSENDTYIYINKYDRSGKHLERIYLKDDTNSGNLPLDYFIWNNKLYAYTQANTYSTPAKQGYIAEVDLDNKVVKFSQKITLPKDISYITGLCADPIDGGFYVLYYNTLWKVSSEGKIQNQWQLQGGQYGGLIFDSYSKGGPYIWAARMDNNQKGIYLEQFDLSTGYFTTNGHYVNSDPESVGNLPEITSVNNAGVIVMSALGVSGSTEIYPGYFSLIGYQEFIKSRPLARQAIVYRLFPIYDWVTVDKETETLNGQGNLTLNFNTNKLAAGDVREGKLIVTSANVSDDLEIPLKLTVDGSLMSEWPTPQLTATVTSDYKVDLNWSAPATDKKVATYRIEKSGLLLGETSAPGYKDESPFYGKQSYTLVTEYADGTIVKGEPVEAEVLNSALAIPVDNFKANVKVRKNVELTWDRTPKFPNAFYEDFESYEPFIIENIGDWTMYDFDRSYTYSNGSYDYENESAKMAGQIFNPSKTQPANVLFEGNGSSQYLAFTCSNLTLIKNDDWMITPELNLPGQSVVRFEGKAYSIYRNKEKLLVGYSTGSLEPEDFTWIGDTIMFNDTWNEIELSVPAEAKRVAFRYQSQDVYQLYLDNIYIGPRGGYSAITGWNLYRDGEKVNNRLITDNLFMDNNLPNGKYHYVLETLYDNGSSAQTELDVTVNADIQANPPRDFTANKVDANTVDLSWNTPMLAETERIRYDNGIPAWGMTAAGSQMWVACQWKADDLAMYDGYSISNIHFHILENCKSVAPFVIEGNNTYIHQAEPFAPKVGEWNDYMLPEPIKLEAGKTYRIGYTFWSDNPDDEYPASQDIGPGIPGTSDLFSTNGKNFYSLYNIMADEEYNCNWCIAVDLDVLPDWETDKPESVRLKAYGNDNVEVEVLEPSEALKVAKKMGRKLVPAKVSEASAEDDAERFLGYYVYKNDNRLNDEPIKTLTYTDSRFTNSYTEYYVAAVYSKNGEKNSEVITFGESGMDAFQAPDAPFDVYTIDGVLLRQNVTSVYDLDNGLYIINGQKVLVK